MFANIFAPLAMKVAGGIIAALVLAVLVLTWRTNGLADERDRLRDQLAIANAQHAVTRQSLAVLENEMNEAVHAGELRAERLEIAREAQEERTALLVEEADRIAAEGAGADCATPKSVLNSRGL